MTRRSGLLSEQIVQRQPLVSEGYSGNVIERVTLRDDRQLVLKQVSPEWDWLSRATNDQGRIVSMWASGLFDRIPPSLEHATVAVEAADGAWSVFMRDVSGSLFAPDQRLDRAAIRRILSAMADLHLAFWGESFPELCGLDDRFGLLSPETARREMERGNPTGANLARGWDVFSSVAPDDIADAVFKLLDRPVLLAAELRGCLQTLIHGDLRLGNLGFLDDRVVLIDWGDRTGTAPPAVELAWFIGFDARRFDVSREEVIADFRGLYGERFEERALQLALIAALVQLGTHFGLGIIYAEDDAERDAATSELAWWTGTVEKAFETWSPS